MKKSEEALNAFKNSFNCSQAVLKSFCNELGLTENVALKIACGFGAGMQQAEVCGAVSGAIMVLGLKYGQNQVGDIRSKEITYEKVNLFCDKFKQRHQTIICRQLLGIDISNIAGKQQARHKGLFENFCPGLIGSAVEILEAML